MKQGLQLRLSQQLAMTPQLQQAIRLLQLSTLELQQELQQALESNPLLEQTDIHDEIATQETQDSEGLDTAEALEQKEMPDELPLDASWDEIYTAGTPSGTGTDYIDDELPVYQGETTQSLQDYLMWQVELTPFSDTDRAIATAIVDAVDDTGYLTVTVQDILDGMGDSDGDIGLEEIEAVLKRVQRFDPVGVAARDLRDCLLIQLSQFSAETPFLAQARQIVSDHLDLLANHDFRSLMRVTRLKEDVLKEAVNLIQSLDPRPGQSIQTGEPEYVIPMSWCASITAAGRSSLTPTVFPGSKSISSTPPCRAARVMNPTASSSAAISRKPDGLSKAWRAVTTRCCASAAVSSNSSRRSLNRAKSI